MISHTELTRLAALQSDAGILSVYLNIAPRFGADPSYLATAFKSNLSWAQRQIQDADQLAVLDREKDRIVQFLEDSAPSGRGVAIFSCQPAEVWEVVPLNVMVPNSISVDTTTTTTLLTRVLDEYPCFAVAIVHRDQAQIYLSEQRTVEEATGITSDVPGQHKQGGWSQARFERRIELKVTEHLKQVVDALEAVAADFPFTHLAVGGGEEAVNELIGLLPTDLSQKVIGTFPVDVKHETETEILDRARAVRIEAERQAEDELIEQIVNAAKSGGQGALGVEATLAAALEGRIHILALAEDVSREGAACRSCDYFAATPFASCPLCGEEAEQTDVIDRAVEKAFLDGARIATVFGEAKERLAAAGGVGALLRY
jgi:peptide chain release factor subunit 1